MSFNSMAMPTNDIDTAGICMYEVSSKVGYNLNEAQGEL